jgi:hypothetical protein
VRPRFHPEAQLLRSVSWKRLDERWFERCTLLQGGGRPSASWILDGTVLGASNGAPLDVRYGVFCHGDWATAEVVVTAMMGTLLREVELVRDEKRWFLDAAACPELDGCVDVDLGFTPATNTLPIRRLGLEVGDSREIEVAWVRFPELTVERFPQCYTRLAERRYLYESLTSDFKAVLTVDDVGLIIEYRGLWERLAEASSPSTQAEATG